MSFEHDWIVIGIPAHNEAQFIGRAIQSLKEQEWTDFLVVISDNASTDGTHGVCQAAIGADPRFRYVRHGVNKGAIDNFNFILEETRSPYFMWLGAHDFIAPNFIASHIQALERGPHFSLSYSLTQWIDHDGQPLRVTSASNIASFRGGRMARFLAAVSRLDECTAINNVLRRSALDGSRFQHILGPDLLLLSELLFRGPAHLVPNALYFRRKTEAISDRMTKLGGEKPLRTDLSQTEALYKQLFDRLSVGYPSRVLWRPVIRFAIRWRFNKGLLRRAMLRTLLRR